MKKKNKKSSFIKRFWKSKRAKTLIVTTFLTSAIAIIMNDIGLNVVNFALDSLTNPIKVKAFLVSDPFSYGNTTGDYFYQSNEYNYYLGACVINAVVENREERTETITGCKLYIEKIEPLEYKEVRLVGIFDEESAEYSIYVFNNGNVKICGGIELSAELTGFSTPPNGKLTESEINRIFQSKDTFVQKKDIELNPGDIKKIYSSTVNIEKVKQYKAINVFYKFSKENQKTILGRFDSINDMVTYADSEGGSGVPVTIPIIIDAKSDEGKTIDLGNGYTIEALDDRILQFLICPTESCKIDLHMEANVEPYNYQKSDTITIQVKVPKYKGQYTFYREIKDAIIKYDFDEYQWNQNTEIQQEIEFSPDIYMKE